MNARTAAHPALARWFKGRRVCVIGLGKSGLAAADFLRRAGARVAVTEKRSRREVADWARRLPRGVECETGGHRLLRREWNLIVASPGVPSKAWAPFAAKGIPVWGELELACRALSLAGRWPVRSAAVTGTNGKTTTTALLGAMCRAAGWKTVVAGNIGTPLCAALDAVDPAGALVLEVSSYQLETAGALRPSVGTVLNVTPDHLARHGTMAGYAAAKFRLFRNFSMNETAVLNAGDPWCRRLAGTVPGKVVWFGRRPLAGGIYARGGRLVSRLPGKRGSWDPPRYLRGAHNEENALAAAACALALGAPARAVGAALREFRGVEHRLEEVRLRRGVRFVNDSKATNVDSTAVALKAFPGGLHVILGGEDKGSPYAPLRPLLKARAKRVLLIGEAAGKIEAALRGAVPLARCGTLEKAVRAAAAGAAPGDVVLLSPACASFDQFDNFEHRGRRFAELVKGL